MDSSSSSASYNTTTATNDNNNWLGFCSPSLSLFYPFFPPPPPTTTSGAVNSCFPHDQDDYTAAGPKLEDFLGGYPAPDATLYGHPEAKASLPVDDPLFHQHHQLRHNGFTITKEYSNLLQQPHPLTTAVSPPPKKPADTFSHRTSIYRGVTRHRWTGRYEAHLWDNTCKREGQSRKGRQVYLGGYDKEEKAARAYDLAALKYWGPTTTTNFPVMDYEKELEEMKHMTRQEFVASLRRKSSGFSRGASMYRGVTRHHQHGRWQARIGRVAGNKDLYLGTFSTQEEAAEAYDIAAIKFRGGNAVTNFDISRYDVKSIAVSNLPVGGLSNKPSSSSKPTSSSSSTTLCFGPSPTLSWPNQTELSIHHEQTPSPVFSMGVSGGAYSGRGDHQQLMNTATASDVSFAVPTSSGSEYQGGRSARSCAAKPNLSAPLHTLIFGME